jgi:hypothetical protein
MPIKDAIALYLSLASLIYVVFERVEKFSSKSDIEPYYLLITVKRQNIATVWHEGILRFFDRIFGRGLRVGTLTMPLFSRTVLLTASIHLIVYILFLRSVKLSTSGFAHPLLPLLTSFVICVPFDFISFAKTRFIMQTATRGSNAYYLALLFLVDVVFSFLLAGAALASYVFVFFNFLIPVAKRYPMISSVIFRIKLQMDQDSAVNWDHTFESMTDIGNLLFNALMDIASLGLSSSIVFIFVLSLCKVVDGEVAPSLIGSIKSLERARALADAPLLAPIFRTAGRSSRKNV